MSLFEAAAAAEDHLVEFNAGKCTREGNWIKPDTRKGKIYMDQGDDQLLHLYWKERNQQSTPEDDLIIFPDEAEFTKVTQCTTGRVYLLRFKTSNEHHFYWLQNKNEDKDEKIVERVNELIRDPDAHMNAMSELDDSASHAELMRLLNNVENQDPNATPENILQFLNNLGSQNDEESGMEVTEESVAEEPAAEPASQVTQPEPITESVPAEANTTAVESSSNSSGQPSAEQLEQFRQILANVSGAGSSSAPLSLNDVLNSQSVTPLLNDPKICESLFPYLPDELEKSVDEVRQVVKSPQFSQALYSLSAALQTGQLGPLLSQLGLDYSAGNSVESFLNAINEQAKKKKSDEDAMDTNE